MAQRPSRDDAPWSLISAEQLEVPVGDGLISKPLLIGILHVTRIAIPVVVIAGHKRPAIRHALGQREINRRIVGEFLSDGTRFGATRRRLSRNVVPREVWAVVGIAGDAVNTRIRE